MDSTLYNAAISGNVDVIFSYIDNKSTDQVLQLHTLRKNNILHLASLAGKNEAVLAILSKHPSLVTKVNSDGNSALHLAAKGGYTYVLRALITCIKQLPTEDPVTHNMDSWKDQLRFQNKENYTALHEATRYNHIKAVRLLLEHDQGFNLRSTNSKESLLYMAASRGFYDLVDLFINDCEESGWIGPCGRSALHGAVDCNSIDCVSRLTQWNKELLHSKDRYGWTPLDSAAYLGYGNLVSELLLHVDSSSKDTYLASKAFLIAAVVGHVSVMKQLIFHSPSCWDIVDDEGSNVLHVAIKHEKKEVIEYLLDECSTIVPILLAQMDNKGNTLLHLIVIYNCCVPKLIQHSMADKEAVNYRGFTPLDHMGTYNGNNESSTSVAMNEVAEEFKRIGTNSHYGKLFPRFNEKIKNPDTKYEKKDEYAVRTQLTSERMRKMVDNHMIVAALIATIAFTAGFAMPGGYVSSGSPNAGTAVLSRNSVAFQTFVISDAVALLFSSSALFTYFISALFHPFRKSDVLMFRHYAEAGMVLNMFGLGSIIVAFISGTYAVLHYSYSLAIASSVVASFTFLIHFGIVVHYIIYVVNI